jgi:hypothetical protein
MITNKGKSIIGKYMLGQAPAYASYLAVGCGPIPLQTEDVADNFATKENLDFEMFRVPISSRGFVNENGIDKIVLTAELPTEERYEITEVGLYSAGSNPSAGAQDSKTVFAFTQGENWEYHTSSAAIAIPIISVPLDPNDDDIINATGTANGVFQTNADNSIFYNTDRVARYERARFLNNTILMQGDDSDLSLGGGGSGGVDNIVIDSGNHIHLTSPNVDFSRNSPIDELKLAFSLVNRDGGSASVPDTIRVLVDFAGTDQTNPSIYARFEVNIEDGVDGYDFATNRYFVVSKQLQELYKSQNFTWDAVNVVKIYVSIFDSLSGGLHPTSDYYIALDAMRLENIATVNPLYGLTGYSVIKNDDATTIIKSPNTNNYVEFRFSIGVT